MKMSRGSNIWRYKHLSGGKEIVLAGWIACRPPRCHNRGKRQSVANECWSLSPTYNLHHINHNNNDHHHYKPTHRYQHDRHHRHHRRRRRQHHHHRHQINTAVATITTWLSIHHLFAAAAGVCTEQHTQQWAVEAHDVCAVGVHVCVWWWLMAAAGLTAFHNNNELIK